MFAVRATFWGWLGKHFLHVKLSFETSWEQSSDFQILSLAGGIFLKNLSFPVPHLIPTILDSLRHEVMEFPLKQKNLFSDCSAETLV